MGSYTDGFGDGALEEMNLLPPKEKRLPRRLPVKPYDRPIETVGEIRAALRDMERPVDKEPALYSSLRLILSTFADLAAEYSPFRKSGR